MVKKSVSEEYLALRQQVLEYTNDDMNLELDNDKQVYIAVFDIPVKSKVLYGHVQTLAMVFGLNTHIYFANGDAITDLEKDKDVMKAMQSLFISAHQVLNKMELVKNSDYYESDNVRAYLKTRRGIFFKELKNNCKEEQFLTMLMNNVQGCIAKIL